MGEVLLEVKDLKTYYPIRSGILQRVTGYVRAVDGVSFTIEDGETLGLVGESGSGKSTTGRSILRLTQPTGGEVWFQGKNLLRLDEREMRPMRRHLQIIFQDPYASLDPRMTVGQILEEPLLVHGVEDRAERRRRVQELLEVVGLGAYHMHRYAHEFSGGQRQRIGIARALALHPKLIVADEPVSALDVSIQSQVLNLMQDLQEQFQLTYLFIAHDLSVVRHISTRIGVMYLGRLVELGPSESVYDEPLHPYTQALLSAVPVPDPEAKRERIVLKGDVPSASNPPSGCAFHPRCPHAMDVCKTVRPEWKQVAPGRFVACHLHA
ncbi:ABC transporter ATP-binding protein [Alicyclobacillus macrosporangiidus]|jgi:oligopeptide/dipeptide ABC transporter ATP-binding protein|uniref:Peptide/nickel transport system ATP-binding protein/oligopeptide transport system ATP-binding protein n=1 Tax=Alicyclobacillus macrosporangiidus TaxID=392015 RepID=A0A1I7J1Q0_9BACL|nr:dipeptide ABC transporter ATP-binding protein [Alicyclobacillus macrosporangiidus]SFU79108.1 peptide/nickel transport system ATP-binding protein/oligopeptide transport system ATP-binding protein [Alicyclobacillus macrosporangiidus]